MIDIGDRIVDRLHKDVEAGVDPQEALHNAINHEMREYREEDRADLWATLADFWQHSLINSTDQLRMAINNWTWVVGADLR